MGKKSQSLAHSECKGRNFSVKININNTSRREWGENDQADTSTRSVNSSSASLLGNNDDNILWMEDETSEGINTIIRMNFYMSI